MHMPDVRREAHFDNREGGCLRRGSYNRYKRYNLYNRYKEPSSNNQHFSTTIYQPTIKALRFKSQTDLHQISTSHLSSSDKSYLPNPYSLTSRFPHGHLQSRCRSFVP